MSVVRSNSRSRPARLFFVDDMRHGMRNFTHLQQPSLGISRLFTSFALLLSHPSYTLDYFCILSTHIPTLSGPNLIARIHGCIRLDQRPHHSEVPRCTPDEQCSGFCLQPRDLIPLSDLVSLCWTLYPCWNDRSQGNTLIPFFTPAPTDERWLISTRASARRSMTLTCPPDAA